jgi:hypothetical protein
MTLLGGPTMFARIGVMRALNRNVVREFNPDRKDTHWAAVSWRATDGSRNKSIDAGLTFRFALTELGRVLG